MNMVNSADYFQ